MGGATEAAAIPNSLKNTPDGSTYRPLVGTDAPLHSTEYDDALLSWTTSQSPEPFKAHKSFGVKLERNNSNQSKHLWV